MMNYGVWFAICNIFSTVLLLTDAVHHHEATGGSDCKGTAYYRLTFRAEWSNDTHPSPVFPENAMFSELIGATHSRAYEMWRRHKNASVGVQNVAETGKPNSFYSLKNRFKELDLFDSVKC